MKNEKLILATRKSPLAMRQAELAAAFFRENHPGMEVEFLKMTTTGDKQKIWSLENKGGKGLFTKELEEALLEGKADFAVHSAKDLPTEGVQDLEIAGYLPRESALDLMAFREDVREPRAIATGSPRRRSQAKLLYPRVCWSDIRGNVETRLKKIVRGDADATILADAGLRRLDIREYPGIGFRPFEVEEMVPAAGQGAIALQCRRGDAEKYRASFCERTGVAVTVERTLLERFGGGCHTAIGIHYDGKMLHVFHENIGKIAKPLPLRRAGDTAEAADIFFNKYLEKTNG